MERLVATLKAPAKQSDDKALCVKRAAAHAGGEPLKKREGVRGGRSASPAGLAKRAPIKGVTDEKSLYM